MELILFLLSVFLISFTGAMMPGPVTAVVIANAKRSPWAGFTVAAGHAVVEIPLILFLSVYAANFMENPAVHMIIAFAGALMLLYIGGDMIRSANREVRLEAKDTRAFIGGIVTSINPYFILWWATAGLALILQARSFGKGVLIFFIITHLSVDFLWDGVLGWLTHRSGVLDRPKLRKILYILLGSCLILVAVYFAFSGFRAFARV
ncbi:MAG: LysE family translocator [Candidatus Marinimicrobia bacterium]|nr:LysE family translocator [Candidatus Neomarinimicrobiota bacterium]